MITLHRSDFFVWRGRNTIVALRDKKVIPANKWHICIYIHCNTMTGDLPIVSGTPQGDGNQCQHSNWSKVYRAVSSSMTAYAWDQIHQLCQSRRDQSLKWTCSLLLSQLYYISHQVQAFRCRRGCTSTRVMIENSPSHHVKSRRSYSHFPSHRIYPPLAQIIHSGWNTYLIMAHCHFYDCDLPIGCVWNTQDHGVSSTG